jgi:hypothetical protein
MANNKTKKRVQLNLSNIPREISLGHLAMGDLVFEEWRRVKKEYNLDRLKNK